MADSKCTALEETERSPGHGWNTSNRFGIDTQGGGNQFDYRHLISQNNTGEVPDALIEEEVMLNESQSDVRPNEQQQQQQQQQQQHDLQKQQHEQLYQQQQHLQQKQVMLQNQKVIVQQSTNRKSQAQQKLLYTVLNQSGGKPHQMMPQNRPARHPGPQQMAQNYVQQGQNRPITPQQSLLNSNNTPTEDELNQQLLQTQQEIEENNKKLALYGLPPVSAVPPSPVDYNTQQLNNCDYMGSMRVPSSVNQSDSGARIRQILTQSQTGQPPQRKVDINFPDSNHGNGAFQTNQNQRLSQGIQGHQKTQVITVSGQRPNILSHTQQRPQRPGGIVQLPSQAMHGHQTTSTTQQSPVQVQTVSTNQSQAQSLLKPATHMQKINKNNVVLEGGGQFEEGQAYVIRDRMGNARTMVWQSGEFHPFDKEKGHMIQHSAIDSSQRGRGARGGRGRGRGRGQGHFSGNATGVHMTQNVRGASPMMNNGMRPVRHSTPIPGRPQINFYRQNLMHQVPHPVNQRGHQLSTQGHIIHTSQGSPSMPVISVVTTPSAPGQVLQQRPKLSLQNLMPAQQLKPKGAEEVLTEPEAPVEQVEQKPSDTVVSDKEHLLDPPNIPNDPNAYAVCQYCGTTSMDKFKCESCKRMFTSATKYVSPGASGDGNPDTKRRKIALETPSTVTTITSVDKNSFYNKKFREQGEIYVKVINAANNTLTGPGPRHNPPRIIRPGYGTRGKRGRGRGRGMTVPETVTISSDEEESGDTNKSQTFSAPATPASVPSRSPSHAGDQPECPESPLIPNIPVSLKRGEKPRVKKMEDAEGTVAREKSPSPTRVTLNARTVRVGTFRGAPVEPILVTENGLSFYIEGVTGTHAFHLYPQEIQQCLAKFDSEPNLIFFLTTQHCAVRTRKDLGMVVHADPTKPTPEHYFDPSGAEMRHQMITIVMDQLTVETRLEFQKYMELFKSWGKQGDEAFFMELSKVEADEIFRQSTSIQQIVGQSSIVPDHGYSQAGDDDRQSDRSPSPKIGFVGPIIKLLTYPPPPAKGGISITNEDLYCLQEGEFLNDVIIDFYLKYLLREKLSQVDHDRTHIFSSFFYKRLTQRIRGAAIDDDPNVTLAVKRHARVKTWTRKLDLFNKDFIVIPINEHAHWFLAIICFPGLEKPVENVYIPNPVSTPLLDGASCPTPPQPSDDGADDMEAEESEDPVADMAANNTQAEKPEENGTSAGDKEKEATESQSNTDTNNSKLENQSDKSTSEKCDDTQSEKTESQSEKAESQSGKAESQPGKTNNQSEEGKEQQSSDESPVEKSESVPGDSGIKQTRSMKTLLKSIRGKAVEAGTEVTTDTVTGVKQPCIIIFDSLSGPSRSRIVTVLKEYLQVEWAVKKGGELNKGTIKGCVPKVPQQNNFSDCGVFMLQYVESFFEDPVQDFSTPMKGLHDWFSCQRIEGKREELRDLIIELKEKYESSTEGKENT